MRIKNLVFSIFLFLTNLTFSQDLMDILQEEQKDEVQFAEATFKTTRITFGHSLETRKSGILEIFVTNRFWDRPTLRSQSFLADRLSTRIALEYAFSDRLTAGFGGTTWDGLFDGFIKYRLLRQSANQNGPPVSITFFQNSSYFSEAITDPAIEDGLADRLSFTTQMLIGSKLTRNLSLQISPTFIHRGLQFSSADPQSHFALGFGGRYKLGRHVSFVSEYYTVFNPIESFDTYGPFSVGVNWELGDVMLQFMLTNAVNMVEDTFIAQTRNNFNFRNPNLNFGFNFTYILHFKRYGKIEREVLDK